MPTDFLICPAIVENPLHRATKELRDRYLHQGDHFALAPQVISEFIHVVSDGRRLEKPLPMNEALKLAESWWKAAEVDQVYPCEQAGKRFFDLMTKHRLGRKRISDTLLAATYLSAGVTKLITGNPGD